MFDRVTGSHAGSATVDARRTGLSSVDAAVLLDRDGPNILPATRRIPAWRRLTAELSHFFALMLWAAAALALVAGMPQLGVAIVVVIVVNGVFAFAQAERAEQATDRLRSLMPTRVTVRRDGLPVVVDPADVVVGDIVLLGPGDRVAADLEFVDAHSLAVDESMLTGESVPVAVEVGSQGWGGTFVVSGEGEGCIVATGVSTRLAGIASLTAAAQRPRSPLATELDRVVRTIAGVAVAVGSSFFVLSLSLGTEPRDGFLFAVGVTVALVPEGLLPTVTLSLAIGAQRMAGRHALVRHLEAVETLGSTTFICTDKTGTLTRNEMTVVEAWTPVGGMTINGVGYEPVGEVSASQATTTAAREMAAVAVACSRGRIVAQGGEWRPVGDPMEAALHAFHLRLGGDVTRAPTESPRRFPFDSMRRRASLVVGGWLVVKGAPDSVLPRCRGASSTIDAAWRAHDSMAARGLRLLAVARRPAASVGPADDSDTAECDLELLGLVALQDPPRPEVAAAIADCRRAGIRLAMVTGDHPVTARAIALQVGLLGADGLVVQGDELPDDDVALGLLLDRDGVVVSRVTPETKLRIARALQCRGHVVAMTGDGVNDAPALREADIGVAMGRSGTDVAREAADLVLLDDNFATIVAAIEHGRSTFANIRRFLTYHLTDNVAELTPFVVWAVSAGHVPLALGVLQVLFLDIGTDLLPALALGSEAPAPGTMERPPHGRHLIDGVVLRRAFGVLGPVEATIEMAAFFAALMAAGWRPGDSFPTGAPLLAASGAAFAAVVVGQMANAFACRSSTRPPWQLGWQTNRMLLAAVAVECAALLGFLLVPPIARLLDHAFPPVVGLAVALVSVPAVLGADALHKWRRRADDPQGRAT